MARKPTLSPSRIAAYLACPVLYRWTYADYRGRWYLRSKSYYSFGATLHKVLERFHNEGDVGVTTTDQVMAAYDESWIDAGFSDAEEMAEAYGEGRQILEKHIEQEARRPITARTISVERLLKTDYEHFRLVGRIDRLDEHEDGTLEVIDYKSGREHVTTDEVASDLAMSSYQLLLSKEYPGKSIKSTIIALRSGEEASASLSAAELLEFEKDLVTLGNEIVTLEDLFEREPVPKRLCLDCDFLPLCKKHPEFAESFTARAHSLS